MYVKDRKDIVLARCDALARNGAWPTTNRLNPRRWLRNFEPDEIDHALDILEALIVVPDAQLVAHLRESFSSLSVLHSLGAVDYQTAVKEWDIFVDKLLVTPVTKEIPHPTQSGYTYARLVRQHLSIRKNQIVELAEAVTQLSLRPAGLQRHLLLVDDLVGSGEQCIKLCKREIDIPGLGMRSLDQLANESNPPHIYYRPIFATDYGIGRIRDKCPWIDVQPTYLLTSKFSALNPDSQVWQDGRQKTAQDFIQKTSARAGLTPLTADGFHKLGLVLSFEYGPPDACLGIIMQRNTDWNPLIERT